MKPTGTYLAIFLGRKDSPRMIHWKALPDSERQSLELTGMADWNAWMEKHEAAVVAVGGPLGRTKRISGTGTNDVANDMGAFVIVRADSHEAAARLFENHPHFRIFPGEAVEVMPIQTIPGV
ncbi:MAG: YciI family protein [Burkholderiaceae bacterium]|jgi:hypothetical protein